MYIDKKVVCKNIVFDCLKECAKHYGIKYHTMHEWLINSCPNPIPQRFVDMELEYRLTPYLFYV